MPPFEEPISGSTYDEGEAASGTAACAGVPPPARAVVSRVVARTVVVRRLVKCPCALGLLG